MQPGISGTHESSGTVESVGPGVTTVKPGDKVIPTYQAQCFASDLESDACPRCRGYREGKTNLCGKIRSFTGAGVMRNGGVRFQAADGKKINHFMGISCFSQYTVLHEESAAKIREDAPLEKVPLLACALLVASVDAHGSQKWPGRRTTKSKESINVLATATTSSPKGTGKFPVGKKSF